MSINFRFAFLRALLGIAICVVLGAGIGGQAQTTNILYSFPGGATGEYPGPIVFDQAGNLYGVTDAGGSDTCGGGCGTVYELSPSAGGWTQKVIYSFIRNGDAYYPQSLTFGASGKLYGAGFGGADNNGAVFELTPRFGGWTEKVIYSFKGYPTDGALPHGNIVIDSAGNIFGTADNGGIGDNGCLGSGCGTVWELSPTASGHWKEKTLYNFLGMTYGAIPMWIAMDGAGNLFGSTIGGGFRDHGTIYKLSPTKNGWIGGVIYRIAGAYSFPSGLSVDSHDNVFFGVEVVATDILNTPVFELSPTANGWSEQVIGSLPNNAPIIGVTLDANGSIIGTTEDTLFEFSNVSGTWNYTALATVGLQGGIIFDADGNIYGATPYGASGYGTVFEITP